MVGVPGRSQAGLPGKLRHGQSDANRIHTGDERAAPGGAALHGVVVHEDAALAAMRSMLGVSPTIRPGGNNPAA